MAARLIQFDRDDERRFFAYIIDDDGEREIIATPEQITWAAEMYNTRRHDGRRLSVDSRIFLDFESRFGIPDYHETRGVLDAILEDGIYGITDLVLTVNSFAPYERELYPGAQGTVQQLPANRGGTWYVVDPKTGNGDIFTCYVKHFSTREAAEAEVELLIEEEEREAADEEYWRERDLDGPAYGAFHDGDVEEERRLICECNSYLSGTDPACGGCPCGCRRGCTFAHGRHNGKCIVND
jgi:hypothetical protein